MVTLEFGPTADTSIIGSHVFTLTVTLKDYPKMDSVMATKSTFSVSIYSGCSGTKFILPTKPLGPFKYQIEPKYNVAKIATVSDSIS